MTKVNILLKPTPLQLFIFQEQHYPDRIKNAKTLESRLRTNQNFLTNILQLSYDSRAAKRKNLS